MSRKKTNTPTELTYTIEAEVSFDVESGGIEELLDQLRGFGTATVVDVKVARRSTP